MSKNWPTVMLGDVLVERHEVPSEADLFSGDVQIVEKIGFNEGRIRLRAGSQTKTGMILIRPGDLVISGINAAKGAIAIHDGEKPVAATIHYGAYTPKKDRVEVKFLWWMLRSRFFRDLLLKYIPGGIKTELKAKRLLPVPVPVPPLAEQRRIVVRIEELAAKIQEAYTLRRQTEEAAGALIGSAASACFQDDKSWTTVRHAVLKRKGAVRSGPFGSQLLHEEFLESGVAAIGTRDVQTNRFEFKSGWCVSPEKFEELRRYQVFPGDILCTIVGASIGRFCVVPKDIPLAFTTKHIQALTLDASTADGQFVSYMLNFHRRCRESLFSQVEGSAQPSLNAEKVLSTALPLPSLREQRKIVTYLDALQEQTDLLKALQGGTSIELDALMPSILDKAFQGAL